MLAIAAPSPSPSTTGAAADAAAIDPTALALLSIFGGALVTALAALLGAWIQSRREHDKWIRERRYDAFVSAFALTKTFDLNWSKFTKIAEQEGADENNARLVALLDQADDLYTTVADKLAPLVILGPSEVAGHYLAMQLAYEAQDKKAFGEAEAAFQDAARKSLRIED